MRIDWAVLLAWIAKSKPYLRDLAIPQSHSGNCWGFADFS
jgi:hypothetical protein